MKLKDFDFRIWDNGIFHYPIKINNDIVDINLSIGINDEIELFTGLYDENGKCGWFFEHFMNDKNNTIEEMSIIGNIHESKELLNVI